MPKKFEKNKLVIVESPAKAKTIEKILGSSYKVISSYGHIIDLPKTKIGVDVNNDFKPSYNTIKGKGEVIKQLKEASKKADKIYLASDPDREGESIAWHIANTLKLDHNEKNRIEFNEITEKAIKDAVKNPRKINIARVNSQQARRILDRLVGYEISPFLWKLISPNTSAGRVQSVALKIICELEDKIKAFVPEKYWDIKGVFDGKYNLNLYKIDDEKIDKLKDEKLLDRVKKDLKKKYEVISSKVSKKTKNPPLPLKTSTLQQLASSYLGFSASKTMMVAQKLYEGISIKGEHKGLITYMRTDSTRISDEAKEKAKNYIIKNFGKEYLGSTVTKTKKESKNVQDAHEGIRPTDINYTPESIMQFLDKDQFKLYTLIWQRFLISQLAAMKYEQFEYILEKDKIQYRGSINKIIFDGYYKVFKEDEDLPIGDFPEIKEGDKFTLDKLDIKEDYTKPPARLTESSLVKTLEADGIGRPSTYASIIDTLKKREYVELQNKSFVPTEIGYEVKTQLDKFFPNIMNIKFTAKLEDELDEVDSGDKNWIDLLKTFYTELQKYEEKCKAVVEEELEKLVVSDVPDKNGKPMIMKIGRFGRYLASQDTESKENISLKGIDISLEDIKKGKISVKKQIEELSKKKEGQKTDIILDNGSRLLLKYGRFGAYLESENYKEDNVRKTIPKEIKTKIDNNTIKKENNILCLKDMFDKIEKEEAEILKKAGKCEKCGRPFKIGNGRWGKFLACTGYPECKNIKKISKEMLEKSIINKQDLNNKNMEVENMKENKPYDDADLESIFKYSQKLIGMTFKNVLENYYLDNKLSLKEKINYFNNPSNKGSLGTLLEEYYYFYKPNSTSEADFSKVSTELKVTPYERRVSSNEDLRAGERLVITMIPYNKEISLEFENSPLKKKISKILMVWYERKKEQLRTLSRIGFVNLFDICNKLYEKDFKIICEDYYKIASKIREGKAHELSEGDTKYLGACTKGATAKDSLQPQYYNKEIPAKRRAFSLKQSYMTYILNNYVKTNLMKYDSILSNEDLKNNSFDDYIINKINQYIGKTEEELYTEFKLNKVAKQKNSILVNKILGVNTENSEEFEKANITIKTIRVEKNGIPKESMSFPKICIREFVKQEFENSYEYNYFAETRFLLVVFKENEDKIYKLKGAKFWNMPIEELETTGKLEWEAYKNKFIEGVNFKISSNRKRIENDLPKKSEHKIFHLRPHSSKSAYLIDGKKYGNGKDSDMDLLPNGDKMVYQCFWLNNTYIAKIIKDIL